MSTKRSYRVIFRIANGTHVEAVCDHVPTLGAVVRIPGTELYGTVVSIWRI